MYHLLSKNSFIFAIVSIQSSCSRIAHFLLNMKSYEQYEEILDGDPSAAVPFETENSVKSLLKTGTDAQRTSLRRIVGMPVSSRFRFT